MFDDEDYREQVEEKISHVPDLTGLIDINNKDFFRLIKVMVKEEDAYNLQNHFERYFSINGFLRNLLNEIIKLQGISEETSATMLIRVLDTLSYFMTAKNGAGLQLRRAPRSAD